MSVSSWVPGRGDVVWIDSSPYVRSEQAGRRPALVLSPAAYNGRVGLAICCPITRQAKGYPFEVPLPEGVGITGVVLSDQIRSLDWRGYKAEPAALLPNQITEVVLERISLFLGY